MNTNSQKKVNRDNPICIGYRIAGQAITAWHYGSTLKRIRTKDGWISLEKVLYPTVPEWANLVSESVDELAAQEWRRQYVMTLYVGELASVLPFNLKPDLSEVQEAAFQLANEICSSPKCSRAWLKWVYAEAQDFLKGEWPSYTLTIVAESMLGGQSITYKHFQHIVHTRPISKKFLRELRLTPLQSKSDSKFVRNGVC